jgi:hypothetical protein
MAALGVWVCSVWLVGCGEGEDRPGSSQRTGQLAKMATIAACPQGETATPMVAVCTLTPGSAALMVCPPTLVSLMLTPAQSVLSQDSTQQLLANGTYTDGSRQNRTSQVLWKSSDDRLATVSNDRGSEGMVTARGFGVVTIWAVQDGVSACAAFTLN